MKKIATTIRPYGEAKDKFEKLNAYAQIIEDAGVQTTNLNLKHFDKELRLLPASYLAYKLKKIMDAHNLEVPLTHAPYLGITILDYDFKENKALQKQIIKSLKVSEALGAHTTVVHAGVAFSNDFYNDVKTINRNLEFFYPICVEAQKRGIKIAIENNVNANMSTCEGRVIEPQVKVLNEVCNMMNEAFDEDIMGICFDVGHSNIANGQPYEELKACGENLTTLHLHNNEGFVDENDIWNNDTHSPLKKGNINMEKIFEILKGMNFKKDIVVESFYRGSPEEIRKQIEEDSSFAKMLYDNENINSI